MTTTPDGNSTYCNGCGAELANGTVWVAAVVNLLDENQAIHVLHLGYACGCAGRIPRDDKAKALALYRPPQEEEPEINDEAPQPEPEQADPPTTEEGERQDDDTTDTSG